MGGGTLVSKYFETVGEALIYSVYNIPFQSFHSIDLIKD